MDVCDIFLILIYYPLPKKKALKNKSWVKILNIQRTFDIDHIQQFVNLWEWVSELKSSQDVSDNIYWKFTSEDVYFAK
jgi:hypothetical protein